MNPELLSVFPQVFCINLERRKDRWAHMERALCSSDGLGLPSNKVTRINAVDMPDNSNLGRMLSHQLAFTTAQRWFNSNRQVPYFMICEDDMVFIKTPYVLERTLKWCRDNMRRWGVVNLSAHAPDSRVNLYRLLRRGDIRDLPTVQKDYREATEIITDDEAPFSMSRTVTAEGTGCYLVNTSALSMLHMLLFSRLGEDFRRSPRYTALMEQAWKTTQERIPFFMVHPRPAIQVVSHSDILQRLHNYIGLYRQEFFVRIPNNPNLCIVEYPVLEDWYDFNAEMGGEPSKTIGIRKPRKPIVVGSIDKSKIVQKATRPPQTETPSKPKEHPLKAFGEWVMSLDKNGDGLIDIEYRTDPEIMNRVAEISEEVYAKIAKGDT